MKHYHKVEPQHQRIYNEKQRLQQCGGHEHCNNQHCQGQQSLDPTRCYVRILIVLAFVVVSLLCRFGYIDYGKYTYLISQQGLGMESIYLANKYADLDTQDLPLRLLQHQKSYLQKKYNVSNFSKQIPICVAVTPSNDLETKQIQSNLKSLFRQQYENYKIIYLVRNNENTEKLLQFIKTYENNTKKEDQANNQGNKNSKSISNRFVVMNYSQNQRVLNIQQRIAKVNCNPQSIYVSLNRKDSLVGTQIFKLLNAIYQSRDVWLVYANYLSSNKRKSGTPAIITDQMIKENVFRDQANNNFWDANLLTTFYTKLLLQLPQSDKISEFNGTFSQILRAEVYPLLQLVRQRFHYIPQIVYILNGTSQQDYNSEAVHRQEEHTLELLKNIEKKQRLPCLFYNTIASCIPSNQLVDQMHQYQPTDH